MSTQVTSYLAIAGAFFLGSQLALGFWHRHRARYYKQLRHTAKALHG